MTEHVGTPTKDNEVVQTIAQLWTKTHSLKGERLERAEEYAAWTIRHIFPPVGEENSEQTNSLNGLGAEATNNLANKIVTTLFNPNSPYFRLDPNKELLAAINDDENNNLSQTQVEFALSQAELEAVKVQENTKSLRSTATMAAKLLIITGNALIFYNKKKKPIKVFNFRNYIVQRDSDGKPMLMITLETMFWRSIPLSVRETIPLSISKDKLDDTRVKLYTKIRLDKETGKWHVRQAIEEFDMPESGVYTGETLPWIALTWHLNKDEDYGRGLVEDYAGDFHALDILTASLIRGLAILADIKFLVRPGAGVDAKELNDSESGSYHTGREGDITSPKIDKALDFQIIQAAITNYEQRIGRAFLMGQATQRNAERVTAEEIRRNANELETVHSGLYSRMVDDWQRPFAELSLADVDFEVLDDFDVSIVAGLETMSRVKEMDNFLLFIQDLGLLATIPDEFRQGLSVTETIAFIGANRGVNFQKFMLSKDELAAKIQQEQARQQQLAVQQAGLETASKIASNPTE